MKNFMLALLFLYCISASAQEVDITELDQIFVDNVEEIDLDTEESTSSIQWTKENTASTFISMREKMKKNKGPVMVFVLDGGDIYETENLVNFMNSHEGRSLRVYLNYMIVDSKDFAVIDILRELFNGGNLFLTDQSFKVTARGKIDYYKTKNGEQWWSAIQDFMKKNPDAIAKSSAELRANSNQEAIKAFDESLDKIKNASFRERRKASKIMKELVKDVGFLLMPVCASEDPEVSHSAKKLLMQTQTGVKFPLTRTIPLWFNFDQQLAIFIKK